MNQNTSRENHSTHNTLRKFEFIRKIATDVDNFPTRPDYLKTQTMASSGGESRGFRVNVGTVPDYSDQSTGMKITAVRDNSPAAKGGLAGGDIILKFGKFDIKNVYDNTYALQEYKPGDEVEVIVQRGTEKLTKKVKLEKDLSLNPRKLLKIINSNTKIVWIANPNNPTGNILLDKKQIENLAKKLPCLLIIDECYFELSGITAVSLINKYPNVVVIRSFSKVFALAGLRLGYIIANEKVTIYLNRLQQANQVFNVNRFAQAAGTVILYKPRLIKSSVKKFIILKESFEKLLKDITLEIVPTKTTFCLVKLPKKITGKTLQEKLAQKGMFIKDCSIYENLEKQYIYLGIPQKRYQKEIAKAIKSFLEK